MESDFSQAAKNQDGQNSQADQPQCSAPLAEYQANNIVEEELRDKILEEQALEQKYQELCIRQKKNEGWDVTPPATPKPTPTKQPCCSTFPKGILKCCGDRNSGLPDAMAMPICTKGRIICNCAYCRLRRVLNKAGHADNAYHRTSCQFCKEKFHQFKQAAKKLVAVFMIHCPPLGALNEDCVVATELVEQLAQAIGENLATLQENIGFIDSDTYSVGDDVVRGFVLAICSHSLAEKLRALDGDDSFFFEVFDLQHCTLENMNIMSKFASLEEFVQSMWRAQNAIQEISEKKPEDAQGTIASAAKEEQEIIVLENDAEENGEVHTSDDSVFFSDEVTRPDIINEAEKQFVKPWRSKRVVAGKQSVGASLADSKDKKIQTLKRHHVSEDLSDQITINENITMKDGDKENTSKEVPYTSGSRRLPSKVPAWPPSKKFNPSKRKFHPIFDEPISKNWSKATGKGKKAISSATNCGPSSSVAAPVSSNFPIEDNYDADIEEIVDNK